jgi:MSHA pilin protein MshA
MNRQQTGFTMIELVIVIVILGILAATALPRFVNLGGDAREAKMQAILGSVKSGAAIVHAATLAKSNAHNTSVDMEGTSVTTIGFYPTANAAGIIAAAGLSASSDNLTVSAGGAAVSSSITIDEAGATTPANCRVTYTAPSATSNTAPTYAIDVTGC